MTKSREPCGLLSPSTGSMRRSPDASSTTGRSKRRRLFGDPGAGKVTCCRRSTATVPRMRPPLLAGKPCSPNAAASCYLARRGGLVQLTELAWVRQLTEATRSQRHDRAALIAAIGSSVRATFQIGGFSIRSQSGVAARATVTRVPAADTGPARKTVKLIMPIWDLPGILRGDQPRPDLPVCKLEAYNFIPSALREMLGLSDGAPDSLVQIASGEINNIALTSEDRLLRCGRKIWINMAKGAFCLDFGAIRLR